MSNQEKLFQAVVENSVAKDFMIARFEWGLSDYDEYEADCICGKKHIKKVNTIRNKLNGNHLTPIGSECIKKFEVD